MSANQPRQQSGVPAGGQFATAPATETGTFLTPEPGWDNSGLVASSTEQLAARRQTLDHLQTTEMVLRDQENDAIAAAAAATTAAEAREAGGTLAEIRFMRATVAMEMDLVFDEIQHIEARIAVAKDAPAVIASVLRMGDQRDRGPMVAALDAETDQGPGHIGYHPWMNPARTAAVTDLTDHLEAMPTNPDAAGWAEELKVLRDPLHVRRARVAARGATSSTAPQSVSYQRALAAETAVQARIAAATIPDEIR